MDTTKQLNTAQNRRQITPFDLKPPTGKESIHIEFTMFMRRELKVPYNNQQNINGMVMDHLETHVAHELNKFALNWEQWPIPEHYVEKAMEDAKKAVINNFREMGLCR